jgi:uncharacterized membrane protein YeaQ/YmgE (transglycosylase-associated protein family)
MDGFLVFTLIGIGVAILHIVIPSEHRVGPASAFALGVMGAWGGALLAGAFHQGGWAMFQPVTLFGAAVGAALSIVLLEIAAEVHVRHEEESL